MGQVLIRNLDNDLIDAYREQAAENDRSLEAELRETLRVLRPMTAKERDAAVERLREIRAMTPKGVKQTPAEVLVREDRDGYRY